jgi:cation diffusion facilitator family transporter
MVNVVSAWLLSGEDHHGHSHDHGHSHEHGHGHDRAHNHDLIHARPAGSNKMLNPAELVFEYAGSADEHPHGLDSRDHNFRAAYVHVIADAAVSVLAIIGLSLAKTFGWMWMDPAAGIVGALVIANWSHGLIRDTGSILLDVNSSGNMDSRIRGVVEASGDRLIDLHVWRVGPGHFAAVVAIVSASPERGTAYYHGLLRRFNGLSHITVEVHAQPESSSG